jgi:all-trans-retinol dehydrogenase (NAD+)
MTSFRNKNVLITGGANGIGKLLGQKSLKEGIDNLIIWDISQAAIDQTVQEFKSKGFKKVHGFQVDVSNNNHIEQAATIVLLEIGNVDILFNNAGIVVGKKFSEHTAKDIEMTLDINVSGVMNVTRVFLKDMLRQGSGHIINISSASAFIGNPKMSVYAGSKWAVLGWSESLRLELENEPGDLHVTTICPSYIDTGMFDGVAAPLLFPLLKPQEITDQIMKAVKNNEVIIKAPDMVNLVPVLKGILPARVFDFFADKLGVYNSMSAFKGHSEKSPATKLKVD